MRKILVTGAAGFVGRHVVKRLLDAGDEVHAVDCVAPYTGGIDPANGWPLFDPRDCRNFHFYKEDCRTWFERVKDSDFDYAFHLAAMVGGRLMIENNPLAVADDLAIDASYWQWAKIAHPKKTACFSSSAAYPIQLQRPDHYVLLKEDMISFESDIGMPDMSYGWAKLTCEYLARLAYEKHGLKSICYRPFSGYGEDQDDAYPFPSICKRPAAERKSSTCGAPAPKCATLSMLKTAWTASSRPSTRLMTVGRSTFRRVSLRASSSSLKLPLNSPDITRKSRACLTSRPAFMQGVATPPSRSNSDSCIGSTSVRASNER